MIRAVLIMIIFFFIFNGCSSKKKIIVEKKELPTWYTSATKNTDDTLFAVGEGEDKKAALINALDSMIATLGITISSEYKSEVILKEGSINNYQLNSNKKIDAKVQKIYINNYELINFKKVGFKRYLVKIKSDKKKLFISLKKDIQNRLKNIQNIYINSKKYHAIKQLKCYKNSLEQINNIKSTLVILNNLDENFDDAIYLKELQTIKNRYETLHSKISFSITSNNDATNLKNIISSSLSDEKYKIKNTTNQKHFTIYISSTTNKIKSYGFYLARSSIFIETKDFKGDIVGSHKLNITGQSSQNYKIAKEDIAIRLTILIKKEGISKIIGLEI
jgi:hypothetical protein